MTWIFGYKLIGLKKTSLHFIFLGGAAWDRLGRPRETGFPMNIEEERNFFLSWMVGVPAGRRYEMLLPDEVLLPARGPKVPSLWPRDQVLLVVVRCRTCELSIWVLVDRDSMYWHVQAEVPTLWELKKIVRFRDLLRAVTWFRKFKRLLEGYVREWKPEWNAIGLTELRGFLGIELATSLRRFERL